VSFQTQSVGFKQSRI